MENTIRRRVFFWILAALFAITTSVVVFYAFGYRFSPERGIFIYGGSATLKTNPRAVEIYINGQPVSRKKLNYINSSYHIDGLKPGSYLLEVRADGFRTWSKKIRVRSGVSTEFWNVVLARSGYEKETAMREADRRFFISPNNKFICTAKKEGDGISLLLAEMENSEKVSELFRSDDYYPAGEEKENIEWFPQGGQLIVPVTEKDSGAKDYLIINVKTGSSASLASLSGDDDLGVVRWDPREKEKLYYLSRGNLYSLKITGEPKKKEIASSVSSYDISSGYIFYFQLPGGIIYRTNTDGSGTQQITTSPPEEMEDPAHKIITYDNDRIAIINKKTGNLFIWNRGDKKEYFRKIGEGIGDIQFSDDGKKLLFWSENEIFVYFTRDWNTQPLRLEDELQTLTRFSAGIENVHWAKLYEHVIFTVGTEVKIIELDQRGGSNVSDIISTDKDIGSVVSNLSKNKIFLTLGKNGVYELFSLNFPEKEGLLGF